MVLHVVPVVLGEQEADRATKSERHVLRHGDEASHFWNDTLRSNVTGSYFRQQNRSGDFGPTNSEQFNFLNEQRSAHTVHVNLIWSPVPQTNFGVEFIRVQGKLQDGQTSEGTRLQASAQFKF